MSSHCLNQWWPISLIHISITRVQCVHWSVAKNFLAELIHQGPIITKSSMIWYYDDDNDTLSRFWIPKNTPDLAFLADLWGAICEYTKNIGHALLRLHCIESVPLASRVHIFVCLPEPNLANWYIGTDPSEDSSSRLLPSNICPISVFMSAHKLWHEFMYWYWIFWSC